MCEWGTTSAGRGWIPGPGPHPVLSYKVEEGGGGAFLFWYANANIIRDFGVLDSGYPWWRLEEWQETVYAQSPKIGFPSSFFLFIIATVEMLSKTTHQLFISSLPQTYVGFTLSHQ